MNQSLTKFWVQQLVWLFECFAEHSSSIYSICVLEFILFFLFIGTNSATSLFSMATSSSSMDSTQSKIAFSADSILCLILPYNYGALVVATVEGV